MEITDEKIDQSLKDVQGMIMEQEKVEGYECPTFILSEVEEKQIHRYWKRGVIVKLLGIRIDYKAFGSILNKMWVRK